MRLYDFKKFEDGAYYRDAVLETDQNIQLNLVDIPMANGILRFDRISGDSVFDLRLGHYALPDVKGFIKEKKRKVKGYDVQIIDNGIYQLAMIPLMGWTNMKIITTNNVHPVSKVSKVINVSATSFPGKQNLYATLMLWKRSGEAWTDNELMPVTKIDYSSINNKVTLFFSGGDKKVIGFE